MWRLVTWSYIANRVYKKAWISTTLVMSSFLTKETVLWSPGLWWKPCITCISDTARNTDALGTSEIIFNLVRYTCLFAGTLRLIFLNSSVRLLEQYNQSRRHTSFLHSSTIMRSLSLGRQDSIALDSQSMAVSLWRRDINGLGDRVSELNNT